MKKTFTLCSLLFLTYISFGQIGPVGHLTIFSEDGDKFSLVLNGELINDVPQTNLRVEDLNQPYYNAKIIFADKSLLDISKNNLMLTDVDGVFSDVTYKIKRDKNKAGKMKMNFFSAIPVQQGFIPPSNVHVIHYGQPQQVIVQQQSPVMVGGVSQTTTTTTQTGGTNVGVGVNIGGINMGVSINDNIGGAVTQTTTTTSSSQSSNQNVIILDNQSESRGCAGRQPMFAQDFNNALASVKKQGFDDTRLIVAKQIASANCLSVNQISQIANVFGFEDNKLTFAMFAYDFCVEPRNYFNLNSIFSFSSNVDSLSEYVQSRQ